MILWIFTASVHYKKKYFHNSNFALQVHQKRILTLNNRHEIFWLLDCIIFFIEVKTISLYNHCMCYFFCPTNIDKISNLLTQKCLFLSFCSNIKNRPVDKPCRSILRAVCRDAFNHIGT